MFNFVFDKSKIKVIAFDLDGTLTQHKTKLDEETNRTLSALSDKYRLLMAGAGTCRRIFEQMNRFPIDIIGNYGLQYAEYNPQIHDIEVKSETVLDCDRESVEKRADIIRTTYGFTDYKGKSVEFHPSGCVTIALIGTEADIGDKLAFDPSREKRAKIYDKVVSLFPDYNVFIGGSSSFDMVPAPYNKRYALDEYCSSHGLSHDEVLYVGDDYRTGGNDSAVYNSDFPFLCTDDYRVTKDLLKNLFLT